MDDSIIFTHVHDIIAVLPVSTLRYPNPSYLPSQIFKLIDAVDEESGFDLEWKERTKEKCLKVIYKHDWRITESGLQAPGREHLEPARFGWDPRVG